MKASVKLVMSRPLCVSSRVGVRLACLENRELNKVQNQGITSAHVLTGSIRDGYRTLVISRTRVLLVLMRGPIVTGTGRPGRVVIHRRIDRSLGTVS